MPLLPGYSNQRLVQIDNTGPGAVDMLTADNVLIAARVPSDWSLLGSRNDLRVVRSTNGGVSGTEIARQITSIDGTARVLFNIQATIAAGTVDVTYYLVGVNGAAGSPPTGITTDTTARLEDFEDNVFQQFLKDHSNWNLDNSRSFAGSQSLKASGLGNSSFNDMSFAFFGTGFDVYWSTDSEAGGDRIAYYVDGGATVAFTALGSGSNAFGAGHHLTVSGLSNGYHRATMTYQKDASGSAGSDAVWVDNLTVNGSPVVYASSADGSSYKGTLQRFSYTVPLGGSTAQSFSYDLMGGSSDPCWEAYTQRLLDYLAPEVFRAKDDKTSLLHQVFSMVARELSLCTETVTLTASSDARGDGAFHVHVRFEPVLTAPLVERVDGNGTVLETYTVTAIADRTLTITGATSPKAGDNLVVTYSYLQKGLEFGVREALLQLNILTSTGEFLDTWGQWFGVARQLTGTYGSDSYGHGLYGTPGTEDDAHFSRRIIDRVLQTRNTKAAIIAAVKTATGGSPYIVEWIDPSVPVGFIFNVTGNPTWAGGESEAALSEHLIMGRTARFRNGATPGGGAYVFEVWVPTGSGYSAPRLLEIVNSYKAAGTKAFIRFQGT